MNYSQEKIIYDNVTPVLISDTTDATPIVVTTSSSHNFSTGDRVLIQGDTTNTTANGIYKVTVLTDDTFSLQDEFTGEDIVGTASGTEGIALLAPPILTVRDYRNVQFQVSTGDSATGQIMVAGSNGKTTNLELGNPRGDVPNFGGIADATNPYSYVQVIPYTDHTPVDGDTGIVLAGTDISEMYEANTNALKYITIYPTDWSQGTLSVKAVINSDA